MKPTCRKSAFTLVEMIVVMTLLTMVLSIAAPSLSGFFKGRALEEESRRFLSLTRYARDEAITRAVPMELWMDQRTGHYGLEVTVGYYSDDDKKPIEFILNETLQFDFINHKLNKNGQCVIKYWPDGVADDQSPKELLLRNGREEYFRIVQDINQYEYKILQLNDHDRIR